MQFLLIYWEKTSRSLVLALRSLWLHKLRAFLSVLGIIFGTAAVISLMAFGEGSMRDALDDIERQGAKNIIIRSVKPPDEASSQRRTFIVTYGLTDEDYERLLMIDSVVKSVPMRIFEVSAARAASIVQPSRQGPSVSSPMIGMKWSKFQALWKPSSSAAFQMSRTSS